MRKLILLAVLSSFTLIGIASLAGRPAQTAGVTLARHEFVGQDVIGVQERWMNIRHKAGTSQINLQEIDPFFPSARVTERPGAVVTDPDIFDWRTGPTGVPGAAGGNPLLVSANWAAVPPNDVPEPYVGNTINGEAARDIFLNDPSDPVTPWVQLTDTPNWHEYDPAWSPSGLYVAYVRIQETAPNSHVWKSDIWVQSTSLRQTVTEQTPAGAAGYFQVTDTYNPYTMQISLPYKAHPTWASDPQSAMDTFSIVFSALDPAVGKWKIYRVDSFPGAVGTPTQFVTPNVACDAQNPQFGNDMATLLFDANMTMAGSPAVQTLLPADQHRIWMRKSDGTLEQLTNGSTIGQAFYDFGGTFSDVDPDWERGGSNFGCVFASNRPTTSPDPLNDTTLDWNIWDLPTVAMAENAQFLNAAKPLWQTLASGQDDLSPSTALSGTLETEIALYVRSTFQGGIWEDTAPSTPVRDTPGFLVNLPVTRRSGGTVTKDFYGQSSVTVDVEVKGEPGYTDVTGTVYRDVDVTAVMCQIVDPQARDFTIPRVTRTHAAGGIYHVFAGAPTNEAWDNNMIMSLAMEGGTLGFPVPYPIVTSAMMTRRADLPASRSGFTVWRVQIPLPAAMQGREFYINIRPFGRRIIIDNQGRSTTLDFAFTFDNIGGFATMPPPPPTSQTQGPYILVVHDYTCGQRFIGQLSPWRGGGEEPYDYVGLPVEMYWREDPNGAYQFYGPQNQEVWTQRLQPDELDQLVGGRYGEASDADIVEWRILSRGPVPLSLLMQYLPGPPYRPLWQATIDPNTGYPVPPGPNDPPDTSLSWVQHVVYWASPYSGNLFVDEGTILDLATQANLTTYVNSRGRLFVSGQDIAWGLTHNGGVPNQAFLQNVLGATYVRDDIPGSDPSRTHRGQSPTLTGSGPIGNGPWYAGGANPAAWGGDGVWQNNAYRLRGDWGALNQAWPDEIAPSSTNTQACYTHQGAVIGVYTSLPSGGKTVYFSFGAESVSKGFSQVPNTSPPVASCRDHRKILFHSINAWFRQCGNLVARVKWGSTSSGHVAGEPIPNAWVFVSSGAGTWAAKTDAQGMAYFTALPAQPGWTMTAQLLGAMADHAATEDTYNYTGLLARAGAEDFSMFEVLPGGLSGTVTDAVSGQPLEGIRVRATSDLVDPNGNPYVGEATTQADGTYVIGNLPVSTYTVEANFDRQTTGNSAYSVGTLVGITVTSEQITPNVNFALDPAPGRIRGVVQGSDTQRPLRNAVVTVLNQASISPVTTGADGAFLFTDVPTGTQQVEIKCLQYQSQTIDVQVQANQETNMGVITLQRIPEGTLLARTVDRTGAPIPGIQIDVQFSNQSVPDSPWETGANGEVLITLPAETYQVYAVDPQTNRGLAFTPDPATVVIASNQQTTQEFVVQPLYTFEAGLQMFGPAFNYRQRDPASVLGIRPDRLRMAIWNPVTGAFEVWSQDAPQANFELLRGRGFFVLFPPEGAVISSRGTPLPTDASYRQPISVTLSPANNGWNVIGTGFNFALAWYDATITIDGQTLTVAQAIAQGMLANGLFTYGPRGYELAQTMAPWKAYWVRTKQALTVNLVPPAGVAAASAVSPEAAVKRDGVAWAVPILVRSSDGLEDSANWIGVAPDDQGLDERYDILEPPSVRALVNGELRASFDHYDYGAEVVSLAADFRPAIGRSQSWDMTVRTTGRGSEVTLSWPDLRSMPRYLTASLTDLASGKTVSMRSTPTYTFRSAGEGSSRAFRVTVRTVGGAYSGIAITGVSNVRGASVVSYRAYEDVTVDIRILNAAGRVVRHLVSGQLRPAGVHEESWNGRSDQGTLMPGGQYTVEIRGVFSDQSVQRATARVVR